MTSRIPVTVVTGGSRSGKSRLIRQLRADCTPGQRWAWLDNSIGGAEADPPEHAGAVEAGHYFHLAGGCACCVAGAAFRVTLVRLLRAGPWDGLHIEVDPAGHGHALVDQLRSPPFDQYLDICRLPVTVLSSEAQRYQSASDLLQPLSRLEMASDILLRSETDGAAPAAAPAAASESSAAFEAWLQTATPWPRLGQSAPPRQQPVITSLPAELPGWKIFSLAEPAEALQSTRAPHAGSLPAHAPACCLVRRWPGLSIGQRREIQALLADLAADGAVVGFQALLRTPRAWYRWQFGKGSGVVGAPDFNVGAHLVEAETAWRLDNRLCLWLRADVLHRGRPPESVSALTQALAAALTAAGDGGQSSLRAANRY